MAAGQGFKTFATGDVLTAADTNGYLMQGVWVFADAAARSAAVTSPQEGNMSYLKDTNSTEYYSGSAWVAVGGSSNSFYAGKNKIINGAFNVWQRGTSFNAGSNAYTADRWDTLTDKTGASVLTTQQAFTVGSAPVSGYEAQYFLRTVFPSGGSFCIQEQRIEDVRTFAGQTVTLSFWAKANATATIAPTIVQNFGSGGSADVETTTSNLTLTTSWVRYSVTAAIPSISGKTIGTSSYLAARTMRAVTASGFTIDIWGVQLEAGSTATDFQTASGSIAGELALCQRYCYVVQGNATNASSLGTGYWNGTTTVVGFLSSKSQMRTTPTLIYSQASDLEALQVGTSWNAVSAVTLTAEANAYTSGFQVTTTGGTNGQAANVRLKALSTAYIGLVAEL